MSHFTPENLQCDPNLRNMVPIFFHHLVDMLNRIRSQSSPAAANDQHYNSQRLGRILIRCQGNHLLSVLILPGCQDSPNLKIFVSFLEASIIWSSSTEISILKNSGSLSLVEIDQCREQIFEILSTFGIHGTISTTLELVRAILYLSTSLISLVISTTPTSD